MSMAKNKKRVTYYQLELSTHISYLITLKRKDMV